MSSANDISHNPSS